MKTNIMVIIVENRDSKAPDVQEVLTKFGGIINARLGLHENDFNEGKIILDLVDNAENARISLQLVTLKDDVPVEQNFKSFHCCCPEKNKIKNIINKIISIFILCLLFI